MLWRIMWDADLLSCAIGRIECTYEPAMTKSFLHGRTEAIRTVQPQSVDFVKVMPHSATPNDIKS